MSAPHEADVVVVGGGLAGLSAAWELEKRGHRVVVLERESHPGGRIATARWHDARVELGAQFLTPGYRRTLGLIDELGLCRDLRSVENGTRIALRHDRRWHYLDAARPHELLTSPVIGWRDRVALGLAASPALMPPWTLDIGDVTSAESLDRGSVSELCGHALADRLFGPVLELLLGYRPHEQAFALLSTFLVPRGRLRTLAGGLSDLVVALASRSDVRCSTRVERVEPAAGGVLCHGRDGDGRQATYSARAAVVAVPGNAALELWPSAPLTTRRFLRAVRYSPINLLYLRTRTRFDQRTQSGLPVYAGLRTRADRDGESLVGVGFLNVWAEDGGLLLAGAAADSPAARLPDEQFEVVLQAEVEALYPELRGEIVATRPIRGRTYVPIFAPGTVARLRRFRSREAAPIALAGDYLAAPCMEGAVGSGLRAAERLDRSIGVCRRRDSREAAA